MSELSKMFYKCQKLANDHSRIHRELDMLIEDKYGYHYTDEDIDEIIDCLDYGHGTMTFREFDKQMRYNNPCL